VKQAVDLDALADLEEQRRFLLQSLHDLDREHEAGDLDEDDYRTLKEDYTARAAAVLHALEKSTTGLTAQRRARPRRSAKVTALVVGAVAVVAILAGVLVATSSGQRVPGQPTSGSVGASGATNDQLAKASQLFNQNKWADALGAYATVLKKDPNNVEALSYGSWALAQLGQVDSAQRSLDRALKANPNYPPAHLFRGLLLLDARNDPKGAVPELQTFLAANPPPPPALVQMVQSRLQEAQAKAASTK
jgi:tetratricopeptide (TPR) repeat protein